MAMVPVLEACRKRKRPKLFNWHTFGDPGVPTSCGGPFRDNIRLFLQQCAEPEGYEVDGMRVWCTLLVVQDKNFIVPLYTIEEDVRHAVKPFCDHCRCIGWGGNLMSRRKYHFIIPATRQWSKRVEEGFCNVSTHLLHGLIHCNGFGHLLIVNGVEGGSKYFSGREIMDLWDRICSNLRARKISVDDVSKKHSMDLRLLYGVAYGYSWFGRWGYRFSRGGFGVTEENYRRAMEILSSMELDDILTDFGDTDQSRTMQKVVQYYVELSEVPLVTFSDLLRFMLSVKSFWSASTKRGNADSTASSSGSRPLLKDAPRKKHSGKEKVIKLRKLSSLINSMISSMDSRWPPRRLEFAADVIVDALKEKKAGKPYGGGGMTRQDVRDAARMHIGDTGLLDYVLKSMNNVIVGSYVVCRDVNPRTRILEYSIREFNNGEGIVEGTDNEESLAVHHQYSKAEVDPEDYLYDDLVYLYENVLLNHPHSELIELAAQAILDTKLFVKEWPFKDEKDHMLRFICAAVVGSNRKEMDSARIMPPGEIVTVPLQATVLELKRAAQIAFRDTYCALDNFLVLETQHSEELGDDQCLFGNVMSSGSEIWIGGIGMNFDTELKFEGGSEIWKVKCDCGAKDDDGERMVECDVCEVWQHTRCNGIEDYQNVPPLFICSNCCSAVVPPRSENRPDYDSYEDLLMIPGHGFESEILLNGEEGLYNSEKCWLVPV